MNTAIQHRGPDSGGFYENGDVALDIAVYPLSIYPLLRTSHLRMLQVGISLFTTGKCIISRKSGNKYRSILLRHLQIQKLSWHRISNGDLHVLKNSGECLHLPFGITRRKIVYCEGQVWCEAACIIISITEFCYLLLKSGPFWPVNWFLKNLTGDP